MTFFNVTVQISLRINLYFVDSTRISGPFAEIIDVRGRSRDELKIVWLRCRDILYGYIVHTYCMDLLDLVYRMEMLSGELYG